MDENGYSRLLKLRFATYVGDQEKDPILIDLSLDCSPTLPPEQIEPLNRISLEGIVTCEYLLYSLPDQLADKLCAVMELQANGFPSSRMKDLVDIVFYATSEKVDLKQLSVAIKAECQKRNMEEPTAFSAPDEWRVRFPTFAARTKIRDEFRDFDAASNLATRFFSPALEDRIEYMCWNPDKLEWIASDGKSALH